MSIDLMVVSPHPDDMEIACGGFIKKMTSKGKSISVVDCTQGEMGSRGNISTRLKESKKASKILGIKSRTNLKIPDAQIFNNVKNQRKLIKVIRKWKPKIALIPYWKCRHPDHYKTSELAYESIFLSGLAKYDTNQKAFRPDKVIYYMIHEEFTPSFIVDISDHYEDKLKSILAYDSQFSEPKKKSDKTYIAGNDFLDLIRVRHQYYGSLIGKDYGEGYLIKEALELEDPLDVLSNQGKTLNRAKLKKRNN